MQEKNQENKKNFQESKLNVKKGNKIESHWFDDDDICLFFSFLFWIVFWFSKCIFICCWDLYFLIFCIIIFFNLSCLTGEQTLGSSLCFCIEWFAPQDHRSFLPSLSLYIVCWMENVYRKLWDFWLFKPKQLQICQV